jgi:hypothetical protein
VLEFTAQRVDVVTVGVDRSLRFSHTDTVPSAPTLDTAVPSTGLGGNFGGKFSFENMPAHAIPFGLLCGRNHPQRQRLCMPWGATHQRKRRDDPQHPVSTIPGIHVPILRLTDSNCANPNYCNAIPSVYIKFTFRQSRTTPTSIVRH